MDDVAAQTIEEARAAASQLYEVLGPPAREVYKDEYIHIPGPAGEIRCRVITPVEPTGPMPVLLYFIGGTYSHLTAYEFGGTPSVLATQANCIMIIPEHRMPPENLFPAGFDDCLATYKWLLENASEINGNSKCIAVGGGSSAGTNAAALCLDAKEQGLPQPVLQWLDIPFLDHIDESTSVQQVDYIINRKALRHGSGILFGHDTWQEWPLRASPLRAPDLSGLAPAYITTAELDPLRDQGKAYAVRLRKAGVLRHAFDKAHC